jgi:Domain of unknown function (DUF5916)
MKLIGHKGLLLTAILFVSFIDIVVAEPRFEIAKTDKVPVIDGVLDDLAWKDARVISDLRQTDPVVGAPPSERTEIYLMYNSEMIFVGFRCHDRQPDKIVAKHLRKDAELFTDDSVYVAFDSMLDRRNAFLFVINPLGTKRDTRIENNSSFRKEWDGIWYADARKDEHGWTAEMAIPVKTLSFNPDSDHWGLNISRRIPRNNEWDRWANVSQDRRFFFVGGFGELYGLQNLEQGLGLDIRPAMATRLRWREQGDDTDFILKPGGEIVYKVTPSLNASLVLNPDFSDTAVDEIQTNLTRFALLFPEQRDFFVRDANIFQFAGLDEVNGMPYFSRRIGLIGDNENPDSIDLDVGTKLTGRYGRYSIGLMNTQMGGTTNIDARNLTVARVTADMLDESRAGLMATYGDPFTDNENGLVGVDFRYRNSNVFGKQIFIADAYFMKSSTQGVDGKELSYALRLDFPNDKWNVKANFTEIQENFKPALGFVNRSGIRQYGGEFRYRIRPGEESFLRTLDLGFDWGVTTSTDNDLESANVFLRLLTAENHSGDKFEVWANWEYETLTAPFEIQEGVVIPSGDYDFYSLYGIIETTNNRKISAQLEWKAGEFFDGTKVDTRGRLVWRPIPQLLLALERQFINTNLPHGNFDIEINRLRLNANFSPTISWTNFLQHETESHFATFNSQLRWIITPGSELTLTFNHDWVRENGSYRSREADFSTQIFWTRRF